MVADLLDSVPESIGDEKVSEMTTIDGIKYVMADDSWLLIRPSGTEPVLRVYVEARSPEMQKSLFDFGQDVADTIG